MIRKSFSENMVPETLPPVTDYLSTGCTILDLAIADRLPGGFAAGRISHIFGPESSAKSVLVAEPLGAAQRKGGKVTLVDAEGTYDFGRSMLFGLNPDDMVYISGAEEEISIEFLFDTVFQKGEKIAKDCGKPSAIGIDSLSSIPSVVELEDDLSTTGYGVSRAKQLSKGFRTHIGALVHSNLALIFIDQTRQNISGMGKKYVFSGGDALKFYASTRVLVEKKANILNKFKKPIGIEVAFRVEKNKIAPPYRDGIFSLLFDYGIDDVRTNIQWLKENDPNSDKKSAWFTLPGLDKKFNSIEAAIIVVEKEGLEKTLRKKVYHVWKEIYHRTRRKERVRDE